MPFALIGKPPNPQLQYTFLKTKTIKNQPIKKEDRLPGHRTPRGHQSRSRGAHFNFCRQNFPSP